MTRVGIIQPNYVPWRGYFDFIDDVDVFVLLNDVQYTDRDWRNRNRVKTQNGLNWITVSVKGRNRRNKINEIEINWDIDWASRNTNILFQNYHDAPWYSEITDEFKSILNKKHSKLSELNYDLIKWINERMKIKTNIVESSSLHVSERKTNRLISLIQKVGGTTYLSGPSASVYIDKDAFKRAGIGLEYKIYDYGPYPQLWGDFEGSVSILDLLMNTGPEADSHLKSRSPNRIAPL